jgi:hypothetical protein
VKTAISIPDGLFEAVERLTRRLGISRSQLFQRAVRAYLEANRDEGVTQALDDVYGPEGEQAGVDRVLERLQRASLPREDW